MREGGKLKNTSMRILLNAFVLSAITAVAWAQATPDFRACGSRTTIAASRSAMATSRCGSSITTQSSRSKRSISRASSEFAARGAKVHNRWKGLRIDRSRWRRVSNIGRLEGREPRLLIEEHEDGRILLSKETWSVIEDGATLERNRERPNSEKQTLFYRRIPVSRSDSKSGFLKARDK
jgi:hypothetical protein